MSDKIIRAVAKNGMVRIIAGITTDLVEDARVIHECTPVASAALGRMLTAGALLGATLKSSNEVMTLRINGGGDANGVVVTAYEGAKVKGYIGNLYGDMPLNSNGKLDVGGYIGKNGNLTGYGGGLKNKISLLKLEGNDMTKFYLEEGKNEKTK